MTRVPFHALTVCAALALAACGKSQAPEVAASAAPASVSMAASAADGVSADFSQYAGHYKIVGKAPGAKDGTKVKIEDVRYTPNRKTLKLASTEVKNGEFVLEGEVDQPLLVRLTAGDFYVQMVLEKGDFTATVDADTESAVGGTLNDQLFAYQTSEPYLTAVKAARQVSARILRGVNVQDDKAVARAFDRASKEDVKAAQPATEDAERAYLNGIIDDKTKPAALRMLAVAKLPPTSDGGVDEHQLAEADALIKEVGPTPDLVAVQKRAQKVAAMEQAKSKVAVGQPYIDVKGVDAKGQPVALSDYVGKHKVVMLDFWASWCVPCLQMIPDLKKAYGKYHDKGLEIVSISVDEDEDAWKQMLAKQKMVWPQAINEGGLANASGPTSYGVMGIPATFLIDAQGKLVLSNSSDHAEVKKKLIELLDT